MVYLVRLLALTAMVFFALTNRVGAQGIAILRDAETEQFLRDVTTPLLKAGDLTPEAVQLYLINDPSLNAFVAGGQNIFVHSGLIQRLNDVDQLKGVLAHEAGHITGGHIARFSDGASSATGIALLSMLLGVAAIAAGGGEAGVGLLGLGQQAAQRSFLSYTRVQESAADQAGLQYLDRAGVSARGMIEVFDLFRDIDLLSGRSQDPYARTHPLSRDRVERARAIAPRSKYYNTPPNPEHQERYQRIRAKIDGYLLPPQITFNKYPRSDLSINARYARVYGLSKALEWDAAIAEAQGLIDLEPNNPYFHEIKGQILFENGFVEESLAPYRQAVDLNPRSPILLTSLGAALVAAETDTTDEEAIRVLERSAFLDNDNSFTWYNLGIAYTRQGMEAKASLASAERALLMARFGEAVFHAGKAVEEFEERSTDWYRAQDIRVIAQNYAEDFKDRRRR